MNRQRSDRGVEVVGTIHFDTTTGRPQLQMTVGNGLDAKSLAVDLLPNADAKAAADFRERQLQEPVKLAPHFPHWWAYRSKVVHARDGTLAAEETVLLVKHCVLRRETSFQRVRREVEAMQNLERVPSAQRERIPEAVRLFVWQRDEGRCVACGTRERLEFDHIIPVAEGGGSTERNVQLLCEACNRRKGRQV